MERFYHEDWLGSTRYLTDSAGGVPAMARYDAYGKQTAGTNPGTLTDNQYAGAWGYEREPDAGLGLDYLYQRYYDSALGRFISPDPIRWAGELNLYGYCDNDPVGAVDPSGLSRDIGGGPGVVRFSLTAYIPFTSVKNTITGDIFGGDNRGPSSNSNRFRSEINFSFDLKLGKILKQSSQCGETVGIGGDAKGFKGTAPADVRIFGTATKFGYTFVLNGGFRNPYYWNKRRMPGTPLISQIIHIDIDRHGRVLAVRGRHSRFPSHELWRYDGGKPTLEWQYDVRTVVGNNPKMLMSQRKQIGGK